MLPGLGEVLWAPAEGTPCMAESGRLRHRTPLDVSPLHHSGQTGALPSHTMHCVPKAQHVDIPSDSQGMQALAQQRLETLSSGGNTGTRTHHLPGGPMPTSAGRDDADAAPHRSGPGWSSNPVPQLFEVLKRPRPITVPCMGPGRPPHLRGTLPANRPGAKLVHDVSSTTSTTLSAFAEAPHGLNSAWASFALPS